MDNNSKSFELSVTTVTVTSQNVYNFIEFEKALHRDLKNRCIQFLLDDVGTHNCLKSFAFAKLHNLEEVYEKSLSTIKTHFDDIIQRNEFKELTFNELFDVLTAIGGQIPSEKIVFCALINWVKCDVMSRGKHVAELFKTINIEKLSQEFIKNVVIKEPLIMESCECLAKLVKFAFTFSEIHVGPSRTSMDQEPETGFLAFRGKHVWKYDTSNKEITKMPDMKHNHNGGSAARLGKYVYVVGGRNHSVERMNLFYPTQGWIELMNTAGYRLWSASAPYNGHVFTFGGGHPMTSSGEEYDVQFNKWKHIPYKMKHKRGFHGLTQCGGFLYATGGVDEKGNNLSSAERLDVQRKCWMPIPSMKKAKGKVVSVALNDKLYVIETVKEHDALASIEMYDPQTEKWHGISSLSQSHHNHGVCVTNGRMYAAGGGSTAIEVYYPEKDEWAVESEFEVLKHVEFIIAV